jgi:hypothetical protein
MRILSLREFEGRKAFLFSSSFLLVLCVIFAAPPVSSATQSPVSQMAQPTGAALRDASGPPRGAGSSAASQQLPLVPRTPSVNARSSSLLQLDLVRAHTTTPLTCLADLRADSSTTARRAINNGSRGGGESSHQGRPYTRESTTSKSIWPNPPSAMSRGSLMTSARAARPRLVEEIETFMQRELFHARQDGEAASNPKTVFERIPIVSEAFNVIIERFTEYRDVLAFIKKEYDQAVGEGHRSVKEAQRLSSDQAHASEYFATVVSAERLVYDAHVKQLELKLRELEHVVAKGAMEVEALTLQKSELQRKLNGATKDAEDLLGKNKLLTENLRQEAVQRAVLLQQGKKIKQDNDKLQSLCQSLELRLKNELLFAEQPQAPATNSASSFGHREQSPPPPPVGAPPSHSAQQRREPPPALSHQGTSNNHDSSDHTAVAAADASLERLAKLERLQKLLKAEIRARQRAEEEVQLLRQRLTAIEAESGDRPNTPRPRWEEATAVCPSFVVSDACSDVLMTRLCSCIRQIVSGERREMEVQAMRRTIRTWFQEEDLCESDLLHRTNKFFVGIGTGPHVPSYLRHHGRLRNRHLTKGTVERMLREMWSERRVAARTEDAAERLPLDEFYLEWLVRKTGTRFAAVEMAYNIQDTCQRHSYDQDCHMFLQILEKKMSETTYNDQLVVVDQFRTVLAHKDKTNKGWLKQKVIHLALIRFFPSKPADNMLKLRFALLPFLDSSGRIEYPRLFDEDDNGNQTPFIEMIRSQHVAEITEFTMDLEEGIRAAATLEASGKVTAAVVRQAVRGVDPGIPAHRLDGILAAGFNVLLTQVDSLGDTVLDVEQFLRNMRSEALLVRTTKVPEAGDAATVERLTAKDDAADQEEDKEEDDSIFQMRQFDNAILDELPKTPPQRSLEQGAPSSVGAGMPMAGRKSTLSMLQTNGRAPPGKK